MSKTSKKPSVQDLQQQVGELTEALQRERADAINVRRRADEEKSQLAAFYKVMIIQHFLPAMDNLERALSHTPRDLANHDYVKGVKGVAKQFEKVFSDLGIKRVKTVGEQFDPHLHEAISIEDTGGEVEIVSEELQPGYIVGDEVIRHAMVKVRKEKR